ncbi:MAG: T9SS type A sorting domain-containing protein [Bacteroidetes bacterium]|nr:T9SS type A sorting domain-containing protein [Bacteroidota bacterium]
MRIGTSFFIVAVFFASLFPASAQDPLIYRPGDEVKQRAKSNAEARYEYFHNRVSWPNAHAPAGAQARAFEQMQKLPVYAPLAKGAADPTWKNVGPDNIGGRIFALAINPLNPMTMYVGAADGGVWRSWDAGLTWTSVSDDFPTQSMGSIVINPVDTSIVYAGTGDASFGGYSFAGAGMFKSTDSGESWAQVGASTMPYARISDMAINPLQPDILYAAVPYGLADETINGIWRSKDGGATWQLVLPARTTDIVINPLNPDILYTVSSKVIGAYTAPRYGVFKTTDGGDNWTKLDIGVTDSLIGRTGIGICASQPDVLYLGVSEVTGAGRTPLMGVFKTTDAGTSWNKLPIPFDYMVAQGWFDNIVGVDPSDPDIVYAGGVKLIRSGDGGQNWERIADQLAGGILHVDQHEIEFDPSNPDRVYVGNDGGLFLLTDQGKTLDKRDIGLSITQFIGGDMYPGNDAFLFGGTQDNGTLVSDRGPEFELSLYGDGGNGYIHPSQPNVMYTTQERLKLWRSEDFGQTWTWAQGTLPNEGSLFYIAYAMDKEDPDVLYVGTYRMYRTSNGGGTWDQLNTCAFPTGGGSCYYVTAVSIAPYDNKIILAAAPEQTSVSYDAGSTWQLTNGQLPRATCSAFRTWEPGVMYATFSAYGVAKVWKSTDYARNWTDITGDLPDVPVNDIAALDGRLVIGTDLGTFVSDNDGVHWQRLGTGMPAVSVQRLLYQQETGVLRAITHGRGNYDLQWKEPAQQQPKFVSRPDTTTLHMFQPFVYAPVVNAWPRPTFRLVEGPQGATVDPVLGVVRWTASDLITRVTIEASNAAGSGTQTFTLQTADVVSTEWEIVQSERMDAQVNHIFVAPDRSLWLARDTARVSRSEDGGRTWTHMRLPNTEVSVISVFAFDRDTAFVGTGGPQSLMNTGSGHIWKTTDGGATWRDVLYGIDSRFGNIHFWDQKRGITVSQGANDSADVFLTSDRGETWTRTAQRLNARIPLYNTMQFVDDQYGWFASSNYYEQGDASVFRTVDGGVTWEEKGAGSDIDFVSDIAFVDPLKGWFIDDVSQRIRRTVSGGGRWLSAFYPMNGERLVGLYADPVSRALWVLSDEYAWVSKDEGTTWVKTTLIPAGRMLGLAFADSLTGWAVTKNGIVEKQIGNPLATGVREPAAAQELTLGAAWPNPVHDGVDGVVIPFTAARQGPVTLTLHNAAGKELATLLDGSFEAGDHFTSWDPRGFSNGVYFITLRSGLQAVTRRIVIAR